MKLMKESKLFVAALGVLASTAVSATETGFKSGFRTGVGAGSKSYKVVHRGEFTSPIPAVVTHESLSKTRTKRAGLLEVHLGYDYLIDGLYSSLELSHRLSSKKNKTRIKPRQAALAAVPFSYQQTHKQDVGISGHPGGELTSCLVAYGIVNFRFGQFVQSWL
jgi:hypothetical protein